MEDFVFNSKRRGPYKKRPGKPVYQFDLEGTLIYMHKDLEVACENLLVNKRGLRNAILKKSCYHQQWYFSHTRNFVVPVKKTNQNPLLSKKPGKMGLSNLPELILPEDLSDEDAW